MPEPQINRILGSNSSMPLPNEVLNEKDGQSDKKKPLSKRKMKEQALPKIKDKFECTENDETISKKDHEKKIAAIKRKVEELEVKNKKLSDEKNTLNEEKKALIASKNESDNKVKKLEDDLQAVKKEREEFKSNYEKLKKDLNKPSEPKIVVDNKEIKRLEKELEKSENTILGLQNDNKYLIDELDSVKKENEILKSSTVSSAEQIEGQAALPMVRIVKIARRTDSDFYSDIFIDGRYSVNIARDGSIMVFRKDIEGLVECKDKTIRLPAMSKFVPFSGPVERNANMYPDGTIKVILR